MDNDKNNKWKEKLDRLPGPDEGAAWMKMELLLDKHKPVQQNSFIRNIILTALLLLLLIGVCNCPNLKKSHEVSKNSFQKQKVDKNIKEGPGGSNDNLSKANIKRKNVSIELDNERTDKIIDKENISVSSAISITPKKDTYLNKEKNEGPNKYQSLKRNLTIRSTINKPILFENEVNDNEKNDNEVNDSEKRDSEKRDSEKSDKEKKQISQISSDINNEEANVTIGSKDTLLVFNSEDSSIVDSSNIDPSLKENTQSKKEDQSLSFGIGYNHFIPFNNQKESAINADGNFGGWKNFIPVLTIKYQISKTLSFQGEVQVNASQYTEKILLYKNVTRLPPIPTQSTRRILEKNVYTKKFYYLNLPFSLNVSPVKDISIGWGFQYSKLTSAIGTYEEKIVASGLRDSLISFQYRVIDKDLENAILKPHEWRFIANASFKKNRIDIGARYTRSFTSFMQITSTGVLATHRHTSLMLYVHYDFLRIKL